MNRNNILIILLLMVFIFALNTVSAMDYDNSTMAADNFEETDSIQLAVESEDILTEDQITVREGDSIQSAIDRASPGSTIIVEEGTYSEDLVVDKELSIIGQNAVLKSDKTAFFIVQTANNTSISGFDIVCGNDGNGIYVNASNCRITDNKITGGSIGIFTDEYVSNNSGQIVFHVVENLWILRNNISNMGSAGISVNAFNPTVSQNRVSNIRNTKENGTAIGIKVNGIAFIPDELKVSVVDNRISNIESLNDSAYGLDVGGNCIFDANLTDFDVSGNVVDNVVAPVNSYGANIGVFSLSTTLPTVIVCDLKISHISSGNYENASVIGLSVSATTIGQNESSDVIVENADINHLDAMGSGSSVTGISATGTGCVDIYISNNKIDDLKASGQIEGIGVDGIDYNNFKSFISVCNNNITDLDSSKIRGINVVSLGNAEINKNILYGVKSDDAVFITGVTLSFNMGNFNFTAPSNATLEEILEFFNKLGNFSDANFTVDGNVSIIGNNLEGTGSGTGFAVVRPATIHYNRAVNLKTNVVKDTVRRFLLESYGYDPNMSNEELAYLLLKSQKDFENYTEEELRNMSVSMGKFFDKFFGNLDNLTAGDVDARYNWWGTNKKPPASKFRNNKGSVKYTPWLTLKVTASPQKIKYGKLSKITADVYTDSSGKDHSSNAGMFFSGPKVTLSTDKGSFNGKKSVTLNWTNGKATDYLKGNYHGWATVVASDFDTASTKVLVAGKDHNHKQMDKKDNVGNLVPMPPAGNPIVLVGVAILLLGCAGVNRRK